jgi:hypothetical protein
MTQPELSVELDELLNKAKQLEAIRFREPFPLDKPSAPCQVAEALDATQQIGDSHDSIVACLEDADKQLAELVDALREAAKDFEEYDEAAAEAFNDDTTVPTTAEGTAKADTSPVTFDTTNYGGSWADSQTDVLVRARQIYETGDQGASMQTYAAALNKYAEYLNDLASLTASPFLVHFKEWEGSSADVANASLDAWVEPLKGLSADCATLAKHALNLRDAYQSILTEKSIDYPINIDGSEEIPRLQNAHKVDEKGQYWYHPRPPTVEWIDRVAKGGQDDLWAVYSELTAIAAASAIFTLGTSYAILGAVADYKGQAPKIYKAAQKVSDDAMANFRTKAGFGSTTTFDQLTPTWRGSNPGNSNSSNNNNNNNNNNSNTSGTEARLPTTPTMPTLPSDVPSDVPTDTSVPTDGVVGGVGAGSSKLPAGGLGGMRAASVGGGGVPLQPPVAAEGAGSAAGRGGTNLGGAGALAGGAAMGGRGGMGMAPMAGQGGKGEDSKAKRAQQDEEALYAEDRPWTEAVIGNRRRKDGPDNKESK